MAFAFVFLGIMVVSLAEVGSACEVACNDGDNDEQSLLGLRSKTHYAQASVNVSKHGNATSAPCADDLVLPSGPNEIARSISEKQGKQLIGNVSATPSLLQVDPCENWESMKSFVECGLCRSSLFAPNCYIAGAGVCYGSMIPTGGLALAICIPAIGSVCNRGMQLASQRSGTTREVCKLMGFCDSNDNKPEEFVRDPKGFCHGCRRGLAYGNSKCKEGADLWCETRRDWIFGLSCVPREQ